MQRLTFRAMGSRMEVVSDSDSPAAAEALAEVPRWFEGWEQALSRFRADSELSRLNRRAGQPVRVSPVMWQVTQMALSAAKHSQGLVTPTLLNELEAAGYDRTFSASRDADLWNQAPQLEAHGQRRSPAAGEGIRCDPATHTVTLPAGVRLDLGGIAKGWAADEAARRLRPHGPALVNAGGDIALNGPRANGDPWPIGIIDPFNPDEQIEVVRVESGGVATSGRDYHRWRQAGLEQHHILDPRTGRPAETDVLAATVIAPTAPQAEMAAKAALILGSRDGLRWLDARPTLAGLLVLDYGKILYSRRMYPYLDLN